MVEPAAAERVEDDSMSEPEQETLIPIAEALEGMNIVGLPDDTRWVGAFMLVKTEDGQGRGGWSARRTEGLSDEELLGVLAVHTEIVRDRIRYRDESDRS